MSLMKEPLGDGRVRVTTFDNYKKHKFTNPDLVWIEEEPLKIFPDCMRPIEDDDEEKRI
jgi:hypothetical protein